MYGPGSHDGQSTVGDDILDDLADLTGIDVDQQKICGDIETGGNGRAMQCLFDRIPQKAFH